LPGVGVNVMTAGHGGRAGVPEPDSGHASTVSIKIEVHRTSWNVMKPGSCANFVMVVTQGEG
jgi:hypothetical protein